MQKNIDIFDLSRSIQYLIIGIICLVILFLAYFFDFSTKLLQVKSAKQQEISLKQQLEEALKQQAVLANDVSHLDQLQKMQADWQKKLIKPNDMPELLNQILKIGAANQLQFVLFSPQAEVKEKGYRRVDIKISVIGGYHQMAIFLSQIANLPWLISIKQINIARGTGATPNEKPINILGGEILLEVYSLDKA